MAHRKPDSVHDISFDAAAVPVSLVEAKAHLRVEHGSEDSLITRLISAASLHVENRIGRSLVERDITLKCDGFPRKEIRLPRPPVRSITSVKYVDGAGFEITLDPSAYVLLPSFVECFLGPTRPWPITSRSPRSVTVIYKAGYGADPADVPEDIRSAILLLVQHFYEHRSAVTEGSAVVTPMAVEALLEPHMTTGWI